MRRILVIGAKGMLGRNLADVLRSSFAEDEVIGWDIEEMDVQEENETITKNLRNTSMDSGSRPVKWASETKIQSFSERVNTNPHLPTPQ